MNIAELDGTIVGAGSDPKAQVRWLTIAVGHQRFACEVDRIPWPARRGDGTSPSLIGTRVRVAVELMDESA